VPDRRLLGILAMAAIISTALAFILFQERVTERIEVLKNEWGISSLDGYRRLPFSEGEVPYLFSLLLRKDAGDLTIRFGILRNSTFEVDTEGWESLSDEEKAKRVLEINELESAIATISDDLKVRPWMQGTTVDLGGSMQEVLLLDYSPFIEPESPEEVFGTLTGLFAVMLGPEGNVSQYYRGYWDFFEDRLDSIQELTVQLNENLTRYANDQLIIPGEELLSTLHENRGRLTFKDLDADDRVFFSMSVNGAEVVGEEAILQLVQIRLEGNYVDTLANILVR
jgi:hypothetical protein